jgi:preprotein translocase subunit SecA
MNSQREVIYKKRRHALFGDRLDVDVLNMIYDTVDSIVAEYQPNGAFEEFNMELIRLMSIESPVSQDEFMRMKPEAIVDRVYHEMVESYSRRVNAIAQQAYPVIRDVFEQKSHMYQNIVVPIWMANEYFR